MIVLHKHKLIFLKARKVAGTSFEIALSRFASDGDIITPISTKDEVTRKALGFSGPMNYRKSLKDVATSLDRATIVEILHGRWPPEFFNHMSAKEAKARLPVSTWREYLKVSVIRDPFDYVCSLYFHKVKDGSVTFRDWCVENHWRFGENQEQYAIDGEVCVDHFIRYENLQEDIEELERLRPGLSGLYALFSSINAKGGHRPKQGSTPAEMFGDDEYLRSLVVEKNRFVIERFGYGS